MGRNRCFFWAGILFLVSLVAGCGSHPADWGSGPPIVVKAAAITTQPASQAIPIGRAATFTVAATGGAPLSYQWTKDGSPVPGATSATYTTPVVTSADSGTTYQVTVSNSAGSATSDAVILTAGPRAPAVGDLRYLLFEQVPIPSPGFLQNGIASNINPAVNTWYRNYIGTPFVLGSTADCVPGHGCGYRYVVYNLPADMSGLTMYYSEANYDSFESELQSIATSNVVIISVDLEPQEHLMAAAWVETAQGGGFDYRLETVAQSDLAATVAADGATSRIVTAVGLDMNTGMADVVSYGWKGDTSTVYEATATIVSPENILSSARAMADQGYIISAFGGNDVNGYALVAMRVKGDSMPRPIVYSVNGVTGQANNPDSAYLTTLVYLEDAPQLPVLIIEEQ